MTDWEQEKRDAQLAFINPDDSLEEARENVDRFYNLLMAKDFIEPFLSNDRLTDQALDPTMTEPDAKEAEADRTVEQNQEQDIEPER